MSLINQMLRDLEQRNKQTAKTAPAPNVPIASQPVGRRPSRLWLLPLMALPLAYLWHQNPASPPAQQIAEPVHTAAIAESKQAAATAEQPAGPDRSQSLAPAPFSERMAPTTLPVTTTPSTTNASPAELQKPAVTPNQAREPAKLIEKSQAAVPKQSPAASLAERSRSQSPAPAPIDRVKTSTPKQQAEALYRQAQHSASSLMAKENLKEALQLDPHYLPARTLLLQTLMKSRADAELGEFLDDSLALFPSNLLFIKTRAHLYVRQKNFAAAVKLLERIDADTVDDSAYLALLAAGYQQLQHLPQAARIYQRLSQIQPDKAENWLGLAIAQDKLNQSQAAVQAYRQALDKKTLNAEVVSYIKQRLTALNPAL